VHKVRLELKVHKELMALKAQSAPKAYKEVLAHKAPKA
jgi:hypothetical protein